MAKKPKAIQKTARAQSVIFLLPSLYAPHTKLRVAFHRLRGVNIGENVHIGPHVFIDNINPQLVTIEDNVGIGANVSILTHDYVDWATRTIETGKVLIKKDSYIGVGAVILKGVTIGRGAVVGAGSVVNKDVGDGDIVAGVPAKLLKKKNESGENQ
jgi:acetyltransferase-like isoleucine patch superfamily enzyme